MPRSLLRVGAPPQFHLIAAAKVSTGSMPAILDADILHAATCLSAGGILISNDRHFEKIELFRRPIDPEEDIHFKMLEFLIITPDCSCISR
jgi:hypothetical protein